MHLARTRSLFFLAFIACASIIGSVVYLQRVIGLSPCLLCWLQRWAFICSGALSLIATLQAPGKSGTRWYASLIFLIALAGAAMAGGQVWLQTATSDEVVPVIAWFERLLDQLALDSMIDRLLSDATFCAEITWSLFGISLPEWSLLAFVGLAMIALYALFRASSPWPTAESRAGD
jgi:disulfide bond formation protein DsbB